MFFLPNQFLVNLKGWKLQSVAQEKVQQFEVLTFGLVDEQKFHESKLISADCNLFYNQPILHITVKPQPLWGMFTKRDMRWIIFVDSWFRNPATWDVHNMIHINIILSSDSLINA